MWLAIDTTGPDCAGALRRAGEEAIVLSEPIGRGHAERLMPMLEELLAGAGAGWADVEAIACCRGPGSFTGLRVGLAAARGLALAADLPLHGVTVFDAFAAEAEGGEPFAVVMDARRGEVWWQPFDGGGSAVAPPMASSFDSMPELLAHVPVLYGSAAAPLAGETGARVGSALASPPITGVLRAAVERALPGTAEPLYLRRPDAKPSRPVLTA